MKTVEGVIALNRHPNSMVYARCAGDTSPVMMGSTLLAHYDRPDDVRTLTALRTIKSLGPTVGQAVDYASAMADETLLSLQCVSPYRDGGEHTPATGASGMNNLLESCLHYKARHCYVFDPLHGWHVGKYPFPERKRTALAHSLDRFFQPLTVVLCTPRERVGTIIDYLEWLSEQQAPKALDPVRRVVYAERNAGDDGQTCALLTRWNDALAGDRLNRDGDPASLLAAYRQDRWWEINQASPEESEEVPED